MASNEYEFLVKHHKHEVGENQCSSYLVKRMKAPIDLVWSLVRKFDQPQCYKPFVTNCYCDVQEDLNVGSVREVKVQSVFLASTSTERLEILDDEEHVFGVRTVAGDHWLKNYTSILTVHSEMIDGRPGTLVVESFVVEVPDGNTNDETCYFAEALIKCNLKSLADVSENLAVKDPTGFTGGSNPGGMKRQKSTLSGHRFTPLLPAKVQMASNEYEFLRKHHKHEVGENQCSSYLVKRIKAPIDLVWSLVRRFDQPQCYKPFVTNCYCDVQGDLNVGSVREVKVQSVFLASTSTERLDILDDEEHVFGVRTVGGDHRLKNYTSILTVHSEMIDGQPGTLVVESFVVDVPDGNTNDETCYFAEALNKCNLKSLADVSESLAAKDPMGCTGGSNPGGMKRQNTTLSGHRFTPLLPAKVQMESNEYEFLRKHHKHEVRENQCSSYLVKRIKAPIDLVWSLVRRFDQPQCYKPFVTNCYCDVQGGLNIGSIREVKVGPGFLPSTSTERLEILDDEEHVFSVRTVNGDHRLKNYMSIVTVHSEMVDGQPGTLVVESFVVDGNTKEETWYLAEALIKCNLKSLADVSESLAAKDPMGLTGGSNPGGHELESKSKAGIVEDKLKSTGQDGQNTVPMEVESEAEFSNQEASSLTVEWTSLEVSLTNGRCSELPEKPNFLNIYELNDFLNTSLCKRETFID